jgi:hypothetical protein
MFRKRASDPVTGSRLQIIFSGAGGGWVGTDVSAIINSKIGNICITPTDLIIYHSGRIVASAST